MDFFLRDIDTKNEKEIDLIVYRTMETVLETIPEFKHDPDLALKVFANFTFDQMKTMIKGDFKSPNHRVLVAIDRKSNNVLGHSIFSVKKDDEGRCYGFCFSRYVDSSARRNGIATTLLKEQELWWREKSAEYVLAHTHETNTKLQSVFLKQGFEKSELIKGKHYCYFELRKPLV